jgi:hypothetical protein
VFAGLELPSEVSEVAYRLTILTAVPVKVSETVASPALEPPTAVPEMAARLALLTAVPVVF